MTMTTPKTIAGGAISDARVDLAAAHRLAYGAGLSEGIFNHLTVRHPDGDRYLQIPFGTHWYEVQASTFMEVSFDKELIFGSGEIEDTCFALHAPLHRLLKDAVAVFHTHMPYASALTRLADMRILPIGQTELMIDARTAYDETYEGLAFEEEEGERAARLLADGKTVLMMAHHGVLVIGRSVAEAYDRLYYVERAAQVQMFAMWTNKPLRVMPDEIIERTRATFKNYKQYGGKPNCDHHFAALRRMLDRTQPDYRD